jgi:hypothetical protein
MSCNTGGIGSEGSWSKKDSPRKRDKVKDMSEEAWWAGPQSAQAFCISLTELKVSFGRDCLHFVFFKSSF